MVFPSGVIIITFYGFSHVLMSNQRITAGKKH